MFDKETLLSVEKKLKLENKEFVEKAYLHELILSELAKSNLFFVFKGGTALYKFYNLPRFSEDLDFCVKDLDLVSKKLKAILDKHNFKFTAKRIYNTNLFRISFKGPLVRDNTLRIDLSTSPTYVFEQKILNPKFADFTPFIINVMSLKEILAEKISALMQREKARDLYDFQFLSRATEFDSELWKTKFDKTEIVLDAVELHAKAFKTDWKKLNTYVLTDLPDFDLIYPLVLEKLNNFNEQLKEKKEKNK
ncbi:MAG: hypothetical protein COT14_02145 [Candidatus Diapherotrites archaeon CG08_land_8_20_14_0_20_30_16]|nr:MAG: hypothetical protein COT14_02145 [Candidatus Diapherotrites archaeon CG08_land_8_20_14_0_20_30_16]